MEVKIIGQDHKGRGIAKSDGKVIFIEGALSNEVCDITITKENKKFQEAVVKTKKIDKSVPSFCPYYPKCGGCDLIHQRYEEQLIFKSQKVKDLVQKFAKINPPFREIISGPNKNYRNKIILHNLGLFQKNTHDALDIKHCYLVDEKINSLITRLKAYQEKTKQNLDEVMIRTTTLNETLLSIKGKVNTEEFIKEFEDVTCIKINGVFKTSSQTIKDKLGDFTFVISPESFYQVNRFLTEKLYQKVADFYKSEKPSHVLDLYCGTGTISLFVSPYVEKVTGIEVVPEAIQNANVNKKLNNVKNVEFICGRVEDHIETFKEVSSIIVDPPRSGLDKKTINHILKIKPETIVYVSCDPVTLSRDLEILKEEYDIKEITPVDMFPNTSHVESVAVLYRKTIEK